MDEPNHAEPKGNNTARHPRAPALATDLTGDLPCLGCGYNLKGLSIRAACPECGTPVRATILARVDPMAEELRPLHRPRLVASGILLWSWAAIAAALCIWGVRLIDITGVMTGTHARLIQLVDLSLLAIVLSGIGAIALIRPIPGHRGWDSCKAAAAVACYALLFIVHRELHAGYDLNMGTPYAGADGIEPGRSWLRLAENLLIIAIILGLRPNAVSLAERSLVMRTGRVDTQPMTALVASLGIASLGDFLLLTLGGINGTFGGLLVTVVLVLIAVGSFLFTLGLFGVGVDTLRLRPVLIQPSPGLSDVLAERTDTDPKPAPRKDREA